MTDDMPPQRRLRTNDLRETLQSFALLTTAAGTLLDLLMMQALPEIVAALSSVATLLVMLALVLQS
ncbi:hypothetical protein SAMN05192552_10668 [Natrinema hispanicum]|uniref:Uncharacterized protein n=1 Tax=Natrinema hispanicum TaxID=392421 RepID=A0A1G6YI78_9EURY|nr:hypothetical protein SAMN05192552_10668 [Natrinema hispanicum]